MTPFDNDIDQILTQAEALLQDEKPVEALALLERARKLQPKHAWMMVFRGVALGQLGRVEEAVEQLLTAADQNVDDIDVQVDAARHLSLLEQFQDALICAERAVALDTNDAGANAVYGEVLERLGRIADAVPYREHAVMLEAADVDSRYFLAVDLCDLGRYNDAIAIADPLLAEFPEDTDIIRLNGACLSYVGRHHEALVRWAELERLDGVTPNLLHNRASTLDVLGNHTEALQTINKAIEIEPDLGLNYYTRGMIHEHMADEAAALEDYIETLVRDPDHTDATINLVELAAASGLVDVAQERIEHLLSLDPESAKLHYARGRLFMEQNDLESAKGCLEKAVRHEPAFGIGWYTLSMLYGMLGEPEAVVAASDRALRYFSDDAGLWFNRGLALHDLKRYPEAMESYDHAANITPDDPTIWLQLGRILLLDLDRPRDARGVLKETLHLDPSMHTARWMLALAQLRLSEFDEAAAIIADLLADDDEHLWGRLVRAALAAQTGNLDAAFADLSVASRQGYDVRLLLNEPLFQPLWFDPRFDQILLGTQGE